MSSIYQTDSWLDAPDGYRYSLRDVDESTWMPLSEAASAIEGFEAPTGNVRQFLAWRIEQGTISAKAGELTVSYAGEEECSLMRDIPVTSEWGTALWSSESSEHWTTDSMRTVVHRSIGLMSCEYRFIAVDRVGIDRLVKHLTDLNNSAGDPAAMLSPGPTAPSNRRRIPRGRPPGSGSFAPIDAPLLDEMAAMIDRGDALSASAAAAALADRARGQSHEAKVRRLRKSFLARQRNGA